MTNTNTTAVLDTPSEIANFQLLSLWKFLKLEMQPDGLRMSRHGSAYQSVKNLFGWRGNKRKIYAGLTIYLTEMGIIDQDKFADELGARGRKIKVSEFNSVLDMVHTIN